MPISQIRNGKRFLIPRSVALRLRAGVPGELIDVDGKKGVLRKATSQGD